MQHSLPDHGSSVCEVLVVDDDALIRSTLCDLLASEGFTVYEAPDGVRAVERLRAHPASLVVLLDWQMPGLDGVQVLHALARDQPVVHRHRFILLTAQPREAQAQTFPADVDVHVMAKPFDVDALLQAVSDEAAHLAPL